MVTLPLVFKANLWENKPEVENFEFGKISLQNDVHLDPNARHLKLIVHSMNLIKCEWNEHESIKNVNHNKPQERNNFWSEQREEPLIWSSKRAKRRNHSNLNQSLTCKFQFWILNDPSLFFFIPSLIPWIKSGSRPSNHSPENWTVMWNSARFSNEPIWKETLWALNHSLLFSLPVSKTGQVQGFHSFLKRPGSSVYKAICIQSEVEFSLTLTISRGISKKRLQTWILL